MDVSIGGRPFTSYIWPERLKKPVLYPLRSATGTLVTRGWPFDPRPGERVDHPHHVGLWFDYGDVNGVDFWNNSDALEPEDAAKMGMIVHRRIVEARGGADRGTLVADMDWVGPGGVPYLSERTAFVFLGDATSRVVDRVTTLTARDRRVVFNDNKEGLFGMRVARQLEQPSTTAEVFTDASGKATAVPVLDNAGVTGSYTSSEGKTGDAVWSTRGRWAMLTGTHRTGGAHARDPRSPEERRVSHLLARARVRPLRGESPRAECLHRGETAAAEADTRTAGVGDVPVSRPDSRRDGDTRSPGARVRGVYGRTVVEARLLTVRRGLGTVTLR